MASQDPKVDNVKRTTISYTMDWGSKSITTISLLPWQILTWIVESPLPPTLLATLLTALHARPFAPLPMVFPPVLLFSTYLNISSYTVDSAGLTAAWSGLYLIMANRRSVSGTSWGRRMGSKFGARGLVRGSAMVLAGMNVVGGGLTYVSGKRDDLEERVVWEGGKKFEGMVGGMMYMIWAVYLAQGCNMKRYRMFPMGKKGVWDKRGAICSMKQEYRCTNTSWLKYWQYILRCPKYSGIVLAIPLLVCNQFDIRTLARSPDYGSCAECLSDISGAD